MRSEPSKVETRENASRSLAGVRRNRHKAATLRKAALEFLEPRTLMATLPASAVNPASIIDVSNSRGDESAPSVAVNQNSPLKMVAAWTRNDPALAPGQTEVVEAAFSSDGGKTWNGLGTGGFLNDPTTTNPVLPFAQASDASVAFDRDNNAYILFSQHKADNSAGALVLVKYDFSTGRPIGALNSVVYEWTVDPANTPTLAVDDSIRTFTDVDANGVTRTQSDPNSGNVYVAWASNETAWSGNPLGANFNPNRIKMVVSSDGGRTFSGQVPVNDNSAGGPNYATAGGVGSTRTSTPRLVVSQGSAPRAPGTNGPGDPGAAGLPPGQVTVVWDDFGIGATAPTPYDQITSGRITSGSFSQNFTGSGGPIGDAGATTPVNTPVTTNFPITVNVSSPRFNAVSDTVVNLALTHPQIGELKIELVPPPGSGLPTLTLLQNQTDAAGTTIAGIGANGANLGMAPDGEALGTVFDSYAERDIRDIDPNTGNRGAAAPFVGHFRPELGDLIAAYKGAIAGGVNSPKSINGTWTVRITDFRNSSAAIQQVNGVGITFTSGLIPGINSVVDTTLIRGALVAPYVTPSVILQQGIGPAPVIASDNTLGAYSPFQGRLYVAYVMKLNPLGFPGNPADNSDIALAFSDDGGLTWQGTGTAITDDVGIKDGFSEGRGADFQTPVYSGRAQLQPSVAVDSATGTLVVSWLDSRNDAARARVATYLTTSIDGGGTFSPDVFTNTPQTATDAITGQRVVIGPIPDNQSTGNAIRDTVAGFGIRQGLAVYGGVAHTMWASNLNGGAGGINHLDIRTAAATFAAGPRVVETTSGPVGEPTDTVNTDRAADGTPIVSAFKVVFDRPVDPATFQPNNVKVRYRDTTVGNLTGGLVPVSSVIPLNSGPFGATTFQVNFAPRSGVGTYSLEIDSIVTDRIRTQAIGVTPTGPSGSFASTDVPKTIPANTTTSSNLAVSGFAGGTVLANVSVTVNITHAVASSLTLTLIAPDGSQVLLSQNAPASGFPGSDYQNTTFSDGATTSINAGTAPFTGVFKPVTLLSQLAGHALNGNWQLRVTVAGTPLSGTITGWSLDLTPGVVATVQNPGNHLDQNNNGVAGEPTDFFASPSPVRGTSAFTGPFVRDTLPLILPGPHVASTQVPGAPASADNLVLDGVVNAIDVKFDRDMNPATVTSTAVLRILGPTGAIAGPFTVTANPSGADPDPTHPRTYRIQFPTQRLSGTYTVTLASTVTDSHGNALDTNLNAGIDLLRGTVTGSNSALTYNYTGASVAIPDGRSVVVPLTVPDDFILLNPTVQLDITHASDPDLQITLVSPNNVPITLVARGTGATGTRSNFSGTIFDDAAATLIQNGGPPFFGRFKPTQPLSNYNGSSTQGVWRLIIEDNPAATNGIGGRLNSWSITFQKGVPDSNLGEPVADQATVGFRIFTMSPTDRQSSTTWTGVGPASVSETTTNNGYAGRVGGIAVDPSDPSGNTVFVAGASGGVWKTSNFMTTSPQGPTYTPLTDFGPTTSLNIGGLAVFTRNNDPRQSIVFAGTGEGAATYGYGGNTTAGVGFLRSLDGGATWQLLDSTNNNVPFASRDHLFAANGGTSTMKVVVDPKPSPSGQVIVYAAMKGTNGGLWRSVDTGATWQKLSNDGVQGTEATDITLDLNSATVDAVSNPTGNVNIIYASFPGHGVYISPNRGQVLNLMTSVGSTPLIIDITNGRNVQVPVSNVVNPTGAAGGRIVLARPAVLPPTVPGYQAKNTLYQGWLYAAVATPNGHLDGVYLTKDNGQNWTKLKLGTVVNPGFVPIIATPTNDPTKTDYDVLGSSIFTVAGYNLSLAVDPNDPNITYLGGTANGNETGLIRIDATRVFDAHSVLAYDATRPDGGALQINTVGRTAVVNNQRLASTFVDSFGFPLGPFLNLIQDPTTPFATNASIAVFNVNNFTNDGSGVRWIPIDQMLKSQASDLVPSSNVHQIVSMVDPITGKVRLIIGDDEGVFTGVLNSDGTVDAGIGNAASATYSRNGNLQTAQIYFGAAQPSATLLNNQVASALFFSNGLNLGQLGSDPAVLSTGNTAGTGSTNGSPLGIPSLTSGDQLGFGVGVDQQGRNVVYRFYSPLFGGNKTDFFQVSTGNGQFISRTQGLVQTANDPQWPAYITGFPNQLPYGNFAVNPLNGDQVIISSAAGRIFGTINQGQFWLSIGEPGSLDGTYAPALTYGAPDPAGPGGIGNLNNFLYAGTVGGRIFITRTGGGAAFNSWTGVSGGLDGSPVVKIIANPTRGSHEAFAVTQKGVYYIADSTAAGASWSNITGNLFSITTPGFSNTPQPQLQYLTSLQADWRYVIPNGTGGGTHPVLYTAGNGGVFRSLDAGTTWTSFPNVSFDGAPADGGYLPNAQVTDLNVSLGKVDPTTGRAVAQPGDPNVLLASTFGRGQFAIRLAPDVFPATLSLDTKLPAPSGSVSGTNPQGLPIVNVSQPVIDGLSEQSAFGNTVRITILDLTDPANPRIIGGYDPSKPATDVPANRTDSAGRFQVQVSPTGFTSQGVKTVGIQATDSSATQGNIATLKFELTAKLSSQQAPAVPTVTLNPADDTSNGFFITRITNPRIVGTTDPSVSVSLFNSDGTNPVGAPIGTTTTDGLGNFSFQYPASPDGTYRVQAVATNTFGSTTSTVFTFRIKTSAPTLTPVLSLDPADDTGVKGDRITSARQPHLIGVTDPLATVLLYKAAADGMVIPPLLATATADAAGNFSVQLPSALTDGQIRLVVRVTDVAGNTGPTSLPIVLTIVSTEGDYIGNGKSTPALFRRDPAGPGLFVISGVLPVTGQPFGSSTLDIPFQGDFDGDGKADLAIYRPSAHVWAIHRTALGDVVYAQGTAGDIPVVGNFEGTGITETAVFSPSTGSWTIAMGGGTTVVKPFPTIPSLPGDVPLAGDFDGVGYDELSFYRPSTGQFFVNTPGGPSLYTVTTGGQGDVPVPGNYDDSVSRRKTEAAVFNPGTGKFVILGPGNTPRTVQFNPFDIPAPGDYNGDGVTDAAVYRAGTASFVYAPSTGGGQQTVTVGQAGDIPTASPLLYRTVINAAPSIALSASSDTGIRGDNITTTRRPFFNGKTDAGAVVDIINAADNRVLGTGVADSAGNYAIQLSPTVDLSNNTYRLFARAHSVASPVGPVSAIMTVKLVTVEGDYFGYGSTQKAIFRRAAPFLGFWAIENGTGSFARQFGAGSLDVPLTGDFYGSGKTDLALYRPSTGQWFVQSAVNGYNGVLLATFGGPNVDIPVPADYNGDGKTDLALYRPTTGEWFVYGNPTVFNFGSVRSGDVPVPANYDDTGTAEYAIYRPVSGQWLINGPSGTYTVSFGTSGDVPVPGNYDNSVASQATELAYYRPNTGQYFIKGPGGNRVVQFAVGDIPAPGDYLGAGYTQAAVFRPSTGRWYYATPTNLTPQLLPNAFGAPTDIPTTSPYRYRALTSSGAGGISASGIPSVVGNITNFNFGATARGLTGNSLTPTPAASPTPISTRRQRPNQAHVASGNALKRLLAHREAVAARKATGVQF